MIKHLSKRGWGVRKSTTKQSRNYWMKTNWSWLKNLRCFGISSSFWLPDIHLRIYTRTSRYYTRRINRKRRKKSDGHYDNSKLSVFHTCQRNPHFSKFGPETLNTLFDFKKMEKNYLVDDYIIIFPRKAINNIVCIILWWLVYILIVETKIIIVNKIFG